MIHREIIILGAGPAGLTAGLQLRRQGFSPLVLEKKQAGGLLHNANLVENYPGFPGGIRGRTLVNKFVDQVERVGLDLHRAEVELLGQEGDTLILETDGETYAADIVVVATGTEPIPFRDVSFSNDVLERVFYDVYPLEKVQGKRFIIVGGGDAALDYALNLGENNQVIILNRGQAVKGLSLLRDRIQRRRSISCYSGHQVIDVQLMPEGALQVDAVAEDIVRSFQSEYLLIAIGRRPALGYFDAEMEDQVTSLVAEGRLYFIGDVKNGLYRQTAIAVGDGLRAAMEIKQRQSGG